MKKYLAILLTLALMAGLFTGCGIQTDDPTENASESTETITGLLQEVEKVVSQRKTHRCLYQRPELIVTRVKLKTT